MSQTVTLPDDIFKVKLSTLFNFIFPGAIKKIRAAVENEKLSVRKILEPHSATTQCENVIGKYEPARQGFAGTPCWICGEPIEKEGEQVCEHALPIAQATLFWGLYDKLHHKADGTVNIPPALALEYGWAHRAPCNSKKADRVFIALGKDGTLRVDNKELLKFAQQVADAKKAIDKRERNPADLYKLMEKRFADMATAIEAERGLRFLGGISSLMNPKTYKEAFRAILFSDTMVDGTQMYGDAINNVNAALNGMKSDLLADPEVATLSSDTKTAVGGVIDTYLNAKRLAEYAAFEPFNAIYDIDPRIAPMFAADFFRLGVINDLVREVPGQGTKSKRIGAQVEAALKRLYANYQREFLQRYSLYESIPVLTYYFTVVRDTTQFLSEEELIAADALARVRYDTTTFEEDEGSPSYVMDVEDSGYDTEQAIGTLEEMRNKLPTDEQRRQQQGKGMALAKAKTASSLESKPGYTKKGGRRLTYRRSKNSKRKTFRNRVSRRTFPGRKTRSQRRTR